MTHIKEWEFQQKLSKVRHHAVVLEGAVSQLQTAFSRTTFVTDESFDRFTAEVCRTMTQLSNLNASIDHELALRAQARGRFGRELKGNRTYRTAYQRKTK